MGLLTFDPGQLRLLRRALAELDDRFDKLSHIPMSHDLADLVRSAHDLVQIQERRVESALREIDTTEPDRWCTSVPQLVTRYTAWGRRTSHWWARATTDEVTPSDGILQSIDCDPLRAGDLIDGLENLELLVLGTADLSLVERVWSLATDPSTTSPQLAGRRIQRLLAIVFDDRPWERGLADGSIDPVERSRRERRLRELVARVVAPWQLDFTRPDTEWPWSTAEGARRLHQISRLATAADVLLAGLPDALIRTLSTLPDDPIERIGRIDAIAQAVGASLEVRRLSKVEQARSSSDLDTLRTIVSTLAIDGPWPLSVLVDSGARWLGDYLDTTDERIRTATLESLSQRQVLASVAVIAVLSSARKRSSSAGPREPGVQKSGSREEQIPVDLAAELRYAYQSIDNAAARGQGLAQLTATAGP